MCGLISYFFDGLSTSLNKENVTYENLEISTYNSLYIYRQFRHGPTWQIRNVKYGTINVREKCR